MGQEQKSFCNCLSITLIILCILFSLLSGWYWYYIYVAAPVQDIPALVIYVISGIIMIVLSILGILAVVKHYENLLIYFIFIMIALFILGLVQIALVIYSSRDCQNQSNPFTFICNIPLQQAAWEYWAPSTAILICNFALFIFAIAIKQRWQKEIGGGLNNYY